ncbi:MAG: hypothetical protein AB7F09_03075 [Parvibaculaceae bacterium]
MPRQLPAGACLRHAVSSVRNNIAYAFRISWPWYAVFVPVVVALSALLGTATGGNPEANPAFALLINLAIAAITMLAFASIAVNWHRYILLDEMPQGSGIFRLDDKTWRYFGNLLLISLVLVAAGIVIGLPLGLIGGLIGALEAFMILMILVIIPVIGVLALRLGIKLPALALDRRDFLLRDAWKVSAGNNLPVFLIFLFEIVIALGAGLVLGLFAYIANGIHPMFGLTLGFALQLLVNWIFTIFSITVLTSLYGFFVEARDF